MKNLVVFNIFIVLLYLCILVGLTTASELGISSCRYLGEIDEDSNKCQDVLELDKLPKQCSSFVYFGVECNTAYDIQPIDPHYGLERLGTLVDYDNISHPVFLFYSHGSVDNFRQVLKDGEFSSIAQSVKNFMCDYRVKGLILHGLDQVSINEIVGNFSQSLIDYFKTIKDINPSLEIGLYLSARSLIEMANDIDLSKIDSIMDFYLIEFLNFNDCSEDLLHGGITPMNSSNPNVITLNDFAAALDDLTIAKDKIYFEFLINPQQKPEVAGLFKPCEISYSKYCENEDDIKSKWCADNTDILYKKGAFTKKYAKGFVGSYIDLVDRDAKCECGNYSTFDMMVNGFNDETDPKNCSALGGS